MAALLAFAALVQLNDPDPFRWIALYAVAAAVSAAAAAGRPLPPAVSGVVSALSLAWAAKILAGGPTGADYLHMFDAWEMRSVAVEEAREASGLLVAGAWLAVLTGWAAGIYRLPTRSIRG
jgi:hypothetical protein